MAYLHSCGLIHRDLKSANLFVTQTGVVKVGDLGTSRLISHLTKDPASLGDDRDLTESESIPLEMTRSVGTLLWTAPELLSPERLPYDSKVDVYAYGIVLFEIAAREYPYEVRVNCGPKASYRPDSRGVAIPVGLRSSRLADTFFLFSVSFAHRAS